MLLAAIGKKVEKIGKAKKKQIVNGWVQSIKNHVYWCASTSNGNPELIREQWMSMFNHIIDIHDGHGKLYKKCPHEKIERDWLEKGKHDRQNQPRSVHTHFEPCDQSLDKTYFEF